MRSKNRNRLCSLIIIITFSTAIFQPQQLWASWEEDAWEDSKEGLKITGIVVGSILVISLIIVLIVGTIEEVSDDEIIWMKNSREQSLHTSFLRPKGLLDTYPAREFILDFPADRHHAFDGLARDEIFLPSMPAPSFFAYGRPFNSQAPTDNNRFFSLNIERLGLDTVVNERTKGNQQTGRDLLF